MSKLQLRSKAKLPTTFGLFEVCAYSVDEDDYSPHMALISAAEELGDVVNVRIHSECITGDVFGSQRCECGEQLHTALHMIGEQGGVLIYLRQEGRGIGIIEKLHAYVKQDEGYDTAEANRVLGHQEDGRSYEDAITILRHLDITRIRLLTNNPDKVNAFSNSGIEVVERLPLEIEPNEDNFKYLKTKKDHFGHILGSV